MAHNLQHYPGPYDAGCSYSYRGPVDLAAHPELALACDSMEHYNRPGWESYHRDGYTVLYADGHVKFIADHGGFVREHGPDCTFHPENYPVVWRWFDERGGATR